VLPTAYIFLFGGFRLDGRSDGLSRRNESGVFIPVPIGRRALDVLALLIERSSHLVTKEEIIASVWGRSVVENANLTVQISALRRVLDEGRTGPSCIQTVAARGYRFVAAVTRLERSAPSSGGGDKAPVSPTENAHRVAPRLSIVVLPFANLSDDREQEYFTDGITEDLTTDLSRITGLLVISRSTASIYRNRPVDMRRLGHELGVRYVLEGSVRRSNDQVRVSAQLIDAEADTHLWAERFDRKIGDFFVLQDEVTSRIAIALDIELIAAETARTTENPDALDYYLRGRAAAAKPKTPANHAEAIAFYEGALALDPQFVQVRSWLAFELAGRVLNQMTDTIVTDLTRADELAEQALSVAPRSWLAHFAKAQVLRAQGRFEEAIPEYETVIELNRNAAYAFSTLGQCKLFAGSLEEAIPLQMQFIRLSPRDPLIGMAYFRIGVTHLLQSRTKEAIVWLERARNALPESPNFRALLASAYALEGAIGAATAELAVARKLYREGRLESIARVKAAGFHAVPGYFGVPKVRALFETTYFEGLRKAGIPEE
jgi:TolB-like protein/Tfp pilus assembly protein PilF